MDKIVNDIFTKLSQTGRSHKLDVDRWVSPEAQQLISNIDELEADLFHWVFNRGKEKRELLKSGGPDDVIQSLIDQEESGRELTKALNKFKACLDQHGWFL